MATRWRRREAAPSEVQKLSPPPRGRRKQRKDSPNSLSNPLQIQPVLWYKERGPPQGAQAELYAQAEEVVRKLGLDIPVTIYQAQNPQGLNASLAYVPNEAHIVLHGPVCSKLTEAEFRALLAHELSHFLLWRFWAW